MSKRPRDTDDEEVSAKSARTDTGQAPESKWINLTTTLNGDLEGTKLSEIMPQCIYEFLVRVNPSFNMHGSMGKRYDAAFNDLEHKVMPLTRNAEAPISAWLDACDGEWYQVLMSNYETETRDLLKVPPVASLADLKAQLTAMQAQIDSHPEAMAARLEHEVVIDAVLPRLTSLRVSTKQDWRHVHLTLDGMGFTFTQHCAKIWEASEVYERKDTEYYLQGKLRDAKKPRKNAASTNAWKQPITNAIYRLLAQPQLELTYLGIRKQLHREIDMPLLDLEAAMIAEVVFRVDSNWD